MNYLTLTFDLITLNFLSELAKGVNINIVEFSAAVTGGLILASRLKNQTIGQIISTSLAGVGFSILFSNAICLHFGWLAAEYRLACFGGTSALSMWILNVITTFLDGASRDGWNLLKHFISHRLNFKDNEKELE